MLRVHRMTWEAPGVLSLELVAPDGADLPGFDPGAHVDVELAPGLTRQYSLCGDPADRSRYRIAVREIAGGQASRLVHHSLRPGARLPVSAPRNTFPLVPSPRHLFIAGGIGITPLLPMLRGSPAWQLHYCVRDRSDAAFLSEIQGDVTLHVSHEGTRLDVTGLLAEPRPDTLVYCCGPDRLMTAVEQATAHWPAGRVHFEWFTPRATSTTATDGFEIVCSRAGHVLSVPADRSILSVLLQAGLDIGFSCEQGICGACETRVLEGEIEHRDSILSAAEQAAGTTMMVCVSRARGARLVLDL